MESLRCPECGRRFSVRFVGVGESWRCPACDAEFGVDLAEDDAALVEPRRLTALLENAGTYRDLFPEAWRDALQALELRTRQGEGLTAHEFSGACYWLIDRLRWIERRDASLADACGRAERELRAALAIAWDLLPGLADRERVQRRAGVEEARREHRIAGH